MNSEVSLQPVSAIKTRYETFWSKYLWRIHYLKVIAATIVRIFLMNDCCISKSSHNKEPTYYFFNMQHTPLCMFHKVQRFSLCFEVLAWQEDELHSWKIVPVCHSLIFQLLPSSWLEMDQVSTGWASPVRIGEVVWNRGHWRVQARVYWLQQLLGGVRQKRRCKSWQFYRSSLE